MPITNSDSELNHRGNVVYKGVEIDSFLLDTIIRAPQMQATLQYFFKPSGAFYARATVDKFTLSDGILKLK